MTNERMTRVPLLSPSLSLSLHLSLIAPSTDSPDHSSHHLSPSLLHSNQSSWQTQQTSILQPQLLKSKKSPHQSEEGLKRQQQPPKNNEPCPLSDSAPSPLTLRLRPPRVPSSSTTGSVAPGPSSSPTLPTSKCLLVFPAFLCLVTKEHPC